MLRSLSKPEAMGQKTEVKTRNLLLPLWARWGLVFPLIVLNCWLLLTVAAYFHPLFTIVTVATLLSFVLDYPVILLRKMGIYRPYAVGIVLLLLLMVLATVGITIAPVLLQQLTEFATRLPSWIDSGSRQLLTLRDWAEDQGFSETLTNLLTNLANQMTAELSSRLQALTGKIVSLAFNTLDSVVNIVVTFVLSIYLLLYGERLWDGLFRWIPSDWGTQVRQSLYQNFHNYFVGQVVVAGVMGGSLTLLFLVMKVPLGLLFGLTIGLMTLVPFGGITSILIVSFLISLQKFGLGVEVLAFSILINQIIDNVVVPRVLGDLTGLNPVCVFISLLSGVKLGGVLGLLLAVPLASFVKNLADTLRPLMMAESSDPPDLLKPKDELTAFAET